MPGESNQEPRWFTIKEAADAFGVSAKTVRRRIKDDKLTTQPASDDAQAPWLVREDSPIGA